MAFTGTGPELFFNSAPSGLPLIAVTDINKVFPLISLPVIAMLLYFPIKKVKSVPLNSIVGGAGAGAVVGALIGTVVGAAAGVFVGSTGIGTGVFVGAGTGVGEGGIIIDVGVGTGVAVGCTTDNGVLVGTAAEEFSKLYPPAVLDADK